MKLKSEFSFLFFGLVFSFQTLSAQYFYIPDNDINALRFKSKNDISVSTNYFLKKRLNIQAGWSPFNNINISAAYFRHNQKSSNFRSLPFQTSGESFTTAIGVYRYIEKQARHHVSIFKPINGVYLQANLGFSTGYNKSNRMDLLFINLSHDVWFIRTGFYLDFKYIHLGFSTRFLHLYFKEGKVEGDFSQLQWVLDRLENDVQKRYPYHLKESTASIRIPSRYVDVFAGYTYMRTESNLALSWAYYKKNHYNLGVVFKINKFFK